MNNDRYILVVVDEKNKMFNVRAEQDPKGKDSLGYWLHSAKRQIRKNVDMGPATHKNHYIVENYDNLEQSTLMLVHCAEKNVRDNPNLVKKLKELRAMYKDAGYKDFGLESSYK